MKRPVKIILFPVIITMAFLFIMCGSSNRLMEYNFNDRTVSAMMSLPPPPEIFTDSFWGVGNEGNIIETAIRIGTTIAKEVEVQKARDKMDSALESVDVPERIRKRTLERCARYLRYRSFDDSEDAEFLFDMHIQKYGIDAKSWAASVHFKIDVRVYLIDNEKNIEIWRKRVRESLPVTRSTFGLPDAAGDVITAVALSQLSEEDMAAGFEHLADYTADRVARKLQEDFAKARSKRE
jgi:hypothetical protein